MSSAVAEKPEAPEAKERAIAHPMDRAQLTGFGADVTDKRLIEEYFEYRDSFSVPGPMDRATLHRLAVEQKRRAKKGK